METALLVVVAVAIALWASMVLSQRRLLLARPDGGHEPLPPVSVLKPLKGLEPRLVENLESFFLQDYPEFEVLFGAETPDDPAVAVAREAMARHPGVPSAIVCRPLRPGWNPKVSNLANALSRARHPIVLISDSNVEAGTGYLRALVPELLRTGVGLVSSLIRGKRGEGLGGVLEELQLNGFVTGSVSMVHSLMRMPCVVGKSMLLRRTDLTRMGGLRFLSRFLAEDQVCGEEIHRLGLRTVVSGEVIDNVLGRKSVREFVDRHVRWSKIRRRVCAPGYVLELLLNPTFLSLVGAAALGTPVALGVVALSIAALSLAQRALERGLGVHRPWWTYPVLELTRSVITGLVWILPLIHTRVVWRGNRVVIGPRTLIQPLGPATPLPAVGAVLLAASPSGSDRKSA